MIFGFFSRKSQVAPPSAVAGSTTGDNDDKAAPFTFPSQQLHTPAPSISSPAAFVIPATSSGSPPPPPTPSPPPGDLVEALYTLISAVPPQTLHAYCLSHLNPATFRSPLSTPPNIRNRRRGTAAPGSPPSIPAFGHRRSPSVDQTPALTVAGEDEDDTEDTLTSETLTSLTHFFRALVPPPQLHCVRCHKGYFELDNTDTSCRVPHDDDSTIVERIGISVSSGVDANGKQRRVGETATYETLWGCCEQVVEGDGDQGPPDGWCYEGMHTVDTKRARFRADSTLHDDKLVSCASRRCFRPPVSHGSTSSSVSAPVKMRKRTIRDVLVADEQKDDDAKSTASSVKRRRRTRKIVSPAEVEDDEDEEERDAENEDEETQKMDIDQPIIHSPPATPRRQSGRPKSTVRTSSRPAASPQRPESTRATRSKSRKPKSKLSVTSTPRYGTPSRREMYVEIRQSSKSTSPVRPAASGSGAQVAQLKKRFSVASLRDSVPLSDAESSSNVDKHLNTRGRSTAATRGRTRGKKALGEIVDSSVAHEMELS